MIDCPANLLAVLEFSSLPMLGWLAAAVLPWLIHRWHRQQHRTTSWAAIELLLSAMQQRARRVQMQQWLLLAIRTAILVLVAIAVAEPALRPWAIGASQTARTHRIIVLDQSFSMGLQQGENSRWQRATSAAIQAIEANQGDVFSLIAWSHRCENVLGRPTFDALMVRSAVEELELNQSSVEVQDFVRVVLASIDRAESEMPEITNHQVVLCTDLCPPTWGLEASEQVLLESLADRASVTLVNVSEEAGDNLAVTDLSVEPPMTMRQQEVEILAKVARFGKSSAADVVVELQIDGRPMGEQVVSVGRNEEQFVRFTHQFVDQGAKTLQVHILGPTDPLPADDQRSLVMHVRPQLRIACLAGQRGAVDDLVRALSPTPSAVSAGGTILPEAFSVNRLGELDLAEYDAVLLGSPNALSQREVESLLKYVRQGGGLGVFLGANIDRETLAGLDPLLPVEVAADRPVGDYRFNTLGYRHPIVAPFRGQTQAGLLGVAIMQYQRMQERDSSEKVLLFDSGDPALVVGPFGLGRVAVSALPGSLALRTPSGTPWSTFPMSPSFLPVIRELVNHLVGSRSNQSNVMVGEAITLPRRERSDSLELRAPDGSVRPLPYASNDQSGQLTILDAYRQGVHQVLDEGQEIARFAVTLDPRESNVQPVSAEQLPKVLAARQIRSAAQVATSGRDFSFTRSLLAAASVLLLAEVAVAGAMGRGWG